MLEEITSPLLTTEWGRRAGLLLMLIFGIFLFVAVVQSPFTWYDDYTLVHQSVRVPPSMLNFTDQSAKLIAQIPQRHLFGSSEVVNSNVIPITSLQLRLVGVIKATANGASRVIISEAGQPGKVYQVGDMLPSGVKVSGIAVDGVILDNGGHLEKLPLQRAPLTFQSMPEKSLLGD